MSTALSKITTRAKAIAKANPKMKWVAAVKSASAEYRAGKLGAVKKKRAVGAVKKKIASVPRKRISGTRHVATTRKTAVIGRLGKAHSLDKKINQLEAKRKAAKGTLRDIIQLEINKTHDMLDQLKKQYKKA